MPLHGKAKNVDKAVGFVFQKAAQGDSEQIFEHCFGINTYFCIKRYDGLGRDVIKG